MSVEESRRPRTRSAASWVGSMGACAEDDDVGAFGEVGCAAEEVAVVEVELDSMVGKFESDVKRRHSRFGGGTDEEKAERKSSGRP